MKSGYVKKSMESVFDQRIITEIDDWNHIDYICVKSKTEGLFVDVYYLDGHIVFEKSLTEEDKHFIDFTRNIECYGISEKMSGNSDEGSDRFYIRVNIRNKQQELKIIEYLLQENKLSFEQNNVLEHLRNMGTIIDNKNDYRALYFCGFSKKKESSVYDNVRFYFKTFGTDESLNNDSVYIEYLQKCLTIKNDDTFQIVQELVLNGKAGLRCIAVDIPDSRSIKVKYYLYPKGNSNDVETLFLELKKYPQYIQAVNTLEESISDIQKYHCDLVQISGGYTNRDRSINLYLEGAAKHKKYYSMKKDMVFRDIGGVSFLIDIHEKHYYDLKSLLSINETGKVIIEYLLQNGVVTIDGVVSHLRSLIKNYNEELYPVIYSDCKMFLEMLQKNGYLQEVI